MEAPHTFPNEDAYSDPNYQRQIDAEADRSGFSQEQDAGNENGKKKARSKQKPEDSAETAAIDEAWEEWAKATSQGQRTPEPALPPQTEDGLARLFALKHSGDFRYCHGIGWFTWDTTRWVQQKKQQAFHWARLICREAAAKAKGSKSYAVLKKANTASAVEHLARTDPMLSLVPEDFDKDIYKIGTPCGTVDLLTGELLKSKREDFITKTTSVAPARKGHPHPKWDKFMQEVTQGDQDVIEYIQKICGYVLTGDISEQILIFIWGGGGNGKSVFLNVLKEIMADYKKTADMNILMASKGERHPTDLASLKGARLVTASETEAGRSWAMSKIKNMTGGEEISARFMRQDFFEYTPQFKLVVIGNHAPQIKNVDDAVKRRFRVIPFRFKPKEVNTNLQNELKEEYPAIFRWMIDGCLKWKNEGLNTPKAVSETTREYINSQDVIGQWIEDCCFCSPDTKYEIKLLFKSWKMYAEEANVYEGTTKSFVDQVIQKIDGERCRGTGNVACIKGISLTGEAFQQATASGWNGKA